jgi:hypothetical protein
VSEVIGQAVFLGELTAAQAKAEVSGFPRRYVRHRRTIAAACLAGPQNISEAWRGTRVTIDTFIAEAGGTLTLGSGALPLEGWVGVAPQGFGR